MTPWLTIITVARNAEAAVRVTSQSLLDSPIPGSEAILIDGASTDGTLRFVEARQSGYDRWISEPDSGIYEAMNKGIREAQGTYLWFLNADDTVTPGVDWKAVQAACLAEAAVHVGQMSAGTGQILVTEDRFEPVSFFSRTVPHQAALIPKDFFQSIGPYREDYRLKGDQEWFFRAVLAGLPFRVLPQRIAHYAAGGISEDPKNRRRRDRENRRMLWETAGPLRFVVLTLVSRWHRSVLRRILGRIAGPTKGEPR